MANTTKWEDKILRELISFPPKNVIFTEVRILLTRGDKQTFSIRMNHGQFYTLNFSASKGSTNSILGIFQQLHVDLKSIQSLCCGAPPTFGFVHILCLLCCLYVQLGNINITHVSSAREQSSILGCLHFEVIFIFKLVIMF